MSRETIPIITIDGPSGSGKGTVSRIVAHHYGYNLLDSGSIYRVLALSAIRNRINEHNEAALIELSKNLDIEFIADVSGTRAMLSGEDVSIAIRSENTGLMASKIAPLSPLRTALLERQRAFAVSPGLVADGRDMGTVVFPDAKLKFYLTASAEERCRRRVLQLQKNGIPDINRDTILRDILTRDERDMKRAVAPLKPADDAVLIDSTLLTINEVVMSIVKHIH